MSFKYCQSNEELNGKCEQQCDHCKEYYKPLEEYMEVLPSIEADRKGILKEQLQEYTKHKENGKVD